MTKCKYETWSITVWKERRGENINLAHLNMQTVRQSFLSRIYIIDCNIEYVKCHVSHFYSVILYWVYLTKGLA